MTTRAAALLGLTGCVTGVQVTRESTLAAADKAPPFSLAAHDGSTVTLTDALAAGPVVLVFYRGHW